MTLQWHQGFVEMPVGEFRVEFHASLVAIQFDVPLTAAISNLNYTTGTCSQPISKIHSSILQLPDIFVGRGFSNIL